MTYSKLKGRIKELYGSESAFAEAMNISKQSLHHKLNQTKSLRLDDVKTMMTLLKIAPQEIPDYFFTK